MKEKLLKQFITSMKEDPNYLDNLLTTHSEQGDRIEEIINSRIGFIENKYKDTRDPSLALEVLFYSLKFDFSLPNWSAQVLYERISKFRSWEYKSLDDAFEIIREGKHPHAQARNTDLGSQIYFACIFGENEGIAMKDVFALFAEAHNISQHKVEKLYYEIKSPD